jgi:protein-arginine kinase activator protein McsA
MRTKLCRTCGKKHPLGHFHFKSRAKGTRAALCRSCRSKYARRHYEGNRQAYRKKARKWNDQHRNDMRRKVLDYLYHHPCVDCGNQNPVVLTFDHVTGSKEDDVSNMIRWGRGWKTIQAEIKKCEVRCANCHMSKTSKERGWWKAIECARRQ